MHEFHTQKKNKRTQKLYTSFKNNKLTQKKKRKYRVLYTQNFSMCRKNFNLHTKALGRIKSPFCPLKC